MVFTWISRFPIVMAQIAVTRSVRVYAIKAYASPKSSSVTFGTVP